jgi:exonuclease 3'-5' domain-containing protein 1
MSDTHMTVPLENWHDTDINLATAHVIDADNIIHTDYAFDKKKWTPCCLPSLPSSFHTVLAKNFEHGGKPTMVVGRVLWVETNWQLKLFLEFLPDLDKDLAHLFCDQEGRDESREGSLTHLQITFAHLNTTFIFPIKVLCPKVFNAVGSTGVSLHQVLEDPEIVKVYFDIRNDSNAIFYHNGVHLKGVIDLQLMELVCRGPLDHTKWVNVKGLRYCVEQYPKLQLEGYVKWMEAKQAGTMWCAIHGYEAFELSPIPEVLAEYAAQDAEIMPHIYAVFYQALHDLPLLGALIMEESQKRVDNSNLPNHKGNLDDATSLERDDRLYAPPTFWVPEDSDLRDEFVRGKLTEDHMLVGSERWWTGDYPGEWVPPSFQDFKDTEEEELTEEEKLDEEWTGEELEEEQPAEEVPWEEEPTKRLVESQKWEATKQMGNDSSENW